MLRIDLRWLVLVVALCWPGKLLAQSYKTIRVQYREKHYTGRPLAWDGQELMLLRRDGRMSMFPVHSEDDVTTVSNSYAPYSFREMQTRLEREFGEGYQVTRTQNFLVVHPPGDAARWANPFQRLYRQFEVYFAARGFQLAEPEFPMVAVVLKTRKEFDRFLHNYHDYDPRLLGYYSIRSNRIITYDQGEGRPATTGNRLENVTTLIHEATHQTAFNRKLHSRYAPQIRWLTEGLAMMFEAPGVHDSRRYRQPADRINQRRLKQLRGYYDQGKVSAALQQLVFSDNLFRTDPDLAYAVSWGLTFYLCEKMPGKYRAYLEADSDRDSFKSYPSDRRAEDFARHFGGNLSILEARMKQFIATLESSTQLSMQR